MNFSFQNKILFFLVRYFRLALIGIIIILLSFSLYFLIMPKISEIREQGGLDYESKLAVWEAKKNELVQLKELEEKISQVTTVEIQKLERILPATKELPDIFRQMENLARDSGLKVTQISITEGVKTSISETETSEETIKSKKQNTTTAKKEEGSLGALTISLSVEGDNTYPALKAFLDNIEDNMRIIDINSLSYAPTGGEQKSYAVNLMTYYLKE